MIKWFTKSTEKKKEIQIVKCNDWIPVDVENMETSHDEILITNEKGWYRVCRCLQKNKFVVSFYDCRDEEIKGFNPTHYMKLTRPSEGFKSK